jgi:hypothetical protein
MSTPRWRGMPKASDSRTIELDRRQGRTSRVLWNGKERRVYHYDAALEYRYTIGCYHGTPTSAG